MSTSSQCTGLAAGLAGHSVYFLFLMYQSSLLRELGLFETLRCVHQALGCSSGAELGVLPYPEGSVQIPALLVMFKILQTSCFQLIAKQKETPFWQGVGAAQRWGQVTL